MGNTLLVRYIRFWSSARSNLFANFLATNAVLASRQAAWALTRFPPMANTLIFNSNCEKPTPRKPRLGQVGQQRAAKMDQLSAGV